MKVLVEGSVDGRWRNLAFVVMELDINGDEEIINDSIYNFVIKYVYGEDIKFKGVKKLTKIVNSEEITDPLQLRTIYNFRPRAILLRKDNSLVLYVDEKLLLGRKEHLKYLEALRENHELYFDFIKEDVGWKEFVSFF